MDFVPITKVRQKYLRYPAAVFEELESKYYCMPVGETDDHDSWVTARFSPHRSQEHVLYMGDDPGNIGLFDVRKFHDRSIPIEERQLHFFPAHDGAIMDIVGVPQKENQIVSISGDSTVRCWDLTQSAGNRKSELFYGHEGSVRSICFAPEDPNVFSTGGRDGKIKIWDMRVSQVKKKDLDCRLPTMTYENAHPSTQIEKPPPGTPRSKAKPKYVPFSVTNVIYLDAHHIATASSSAESGIRIWDVRMPTRNGEGKATRTLKVPTSKGQKMFGVAYMSLDRFGSRLFASCTNSTIFEYSILSASLTPINSYSGSKVVDFYTQLACSPVADVIACGSEDNRAIMWDLQNQYHYQNDRFFPDQIDKRRTQLPKYYFGGHQKKVQNVGWSADGRYFMSMDEGGVRIWKQPRNRKPWQLNEEDIVPASSSNDLGLSYETVKLFEMADPDTAMSCIDSISISPRQRLDSAGTSSPQKSRGAKRPIASSPFKTINSPRLLNRSPRAKMFRLTSPNSSCSDLPLQPSLSGNTDKEYGYFTPRHNRTNIRKRGNPFYYKHPTENLPNFVYDNFCKKMIGKTADDGDQKSLSKTSRKRIEDWWQEKTAENVATAVRRRLPSVSEFGESACSKVLPEEERNALRSPRKMVLKAYSGSLGVPSDVSSPSTPSTSSESQSQSQNLSQPQSKYRTPTATTYNRRSVTQTPAKPSGHRPTSRNLLHYFKK